MPRTPAEQARLDRFAREYEISQHDLLLDIERAVCGCAYGGTSWTTRQEAEQVGALLGLTARTRFLDVGAGAGWPGLYLARISGCHVTLADVPLEGLRIASARAAAEPLAGGYWVIVADAAALPLQGAAFDAIGHSDVLCCLESKLSVLKECRRVTLVGGRMAFTVILIAPSLSRADYKLALDAGPRFKETVIGYPEMLERSGWRMTHHMDLTTEYAQAARHMLREEEKHAGPLAKLLGDAEYAERLRRRRYTVHALDKGLLRRELFAANAA
jgi:ubiquinone/menaquinone biosynthesis C-methylase UbiE